MANALFPQPECLLLEPLSSASCPYSPLLFLFWVQSIFSEDKQGTSFGFSTLAWRLQQPGDWEPGRWDGVRKEGRRGRTLLASR